MDHLTEAISILVFLCNSGHVICHARTYAVLIFVFAITLYSRAHGAIYICCARDACTKSSTCTYTNDVLVVSIETPKHVLLEIHMHKYVQARYNRLERFPVPSK